MATLVLGVVGRAFLGPIGGVVGTLLGAGIDRRLFGGRRQAARSALPDIQAASYGEPIPLVFGRMRVSGNLVWAAPVKESTVRSGGGKRGPSTTSYAYSASFAVVLSAREIIGVGRIWADGKLMRDASGQWLSPATMRLHTGSQRQQPDPLMMAAEGAAPAFRGLAYAVFEDLPLADYGNRLPNLSFEVIAEDAPVDLGATLSGLAQRAGIDLPVRGAFPSVTGYFAGTVGPMADLLAPALDASGAMLAAGTALVGTGLPGQLIDLADAVNSVASGNRASDRDRQRDRQRRAAAASLADAVEIGYYDTDRDFQPGLQRFRLRAGARVDGRGLPAALNAAAAKQLGRDAALRLAASRQRRTLRLPWRHLGLQPGDVLSLPDGDWHVAELRFESFVVAVDLVRLPGAPPPPPVGDSGRALDHGDLPAGPTSLLVMDLPPLPGELPDRPRLWLAGAGSAPGWRRARVAISVDGGTSYEDAGLLPAPALMGSALTLLPPASPAGWDRISTVEVELLAEAMWLESRSEEAVLAGANLALLGDELIQFTSATALGERRFRLSGLLRGRRGTSSGPAGQPAGSRFVLIDPAIMLPLPLPIEQLGAPLLVRAAGSGDSAAVPMLTIVGKAAIQPLPPVHLAVTRKDDLLRFSWIPQSRAGFGWPDLTDVPLGEAAPLWRATLRDAAGPIETADVSSPFWMVADRPGPLWLDVAQLGATLGRVATLAIP